MLSTLQDYGHIEIDQCLDEAVPAIENNRTWSQWNLSAVIARIHDIEHVKTDWIGPEREPEAAHIYLRVGKNQVKLELVRNEDGKWGTYKFDEAVLITPEGKSAGKVSGGLVRILKDYFPSHSPTSGAQPQPN